MHKRAACNSLKNVTTLSEVDEDKVSEVLYSAVLSSIELIMTPPALVETDKEPDSYFDDVFAKNKRIHP